jgi:hypothetical protein
VNDSARASRALVSGLVAGAIHYTVTGVVNGVILRQQLEGWMGGAHDLLHPRAPAISMSLWAVMSACYGVIGMWWYGGMRTSRGAGISTALRVGIALWIVSKFAIALDLLALGLMPTGIIVGQSIGGLAAILLGILAGAWYLDGWRGRSDARGR